MTVEELRRQYLVVPEVIIYKVLQQILKFLREDVKNNNDSPDSYLLRLCGNLTTADNRYKYYQQCKKVFSDKVDDPKFLGLHMSYNQDTATPNSVCISHSGENQSTMNGLGVDENFHKEEGEVYSNGQYSSTYTRRFSATYTLYITSDNSNEVVLIYQILKSLLVSFTQRFSILGLENMKFSGQDLMFKQDYTPKAHTKALSLGFEYDTHSLDIDKDNQVAGIIFQGLMKEM